MSGPRQYRQLYRTPIWPRAESGITIGIGYDLRFASLDQFHADWADRVPPTAIAALAEVLGQLGSLARLDHVRDVEVPLLDAVSAAGHLEGVADQIDAMARLWDPERLPGLVRRRHNEARLWRSGFPALQLARRPAALRPG